MAFYNIWIPRFGSTEQEPITRLSEGHEIDWQQQAFKAAMKHASEINTGDTVIVLMSVTDGRFYDRFTFGVTKNEDHYKTDYLGVGSTH